MAADESKADKDMKEEEQGEDEASCEGDKNKDEEGDKGTEEVFIPQAEYSAVCNADFLPMICNDFIQEFLDKEHGACTIPRIEAINLTRNFCHWIADNGLTCARI